MVVKKPRVDYFTKLPAEMRLETYEWVLATAYGSAGANLRSFTMPALCGVSKLVRGEVLPLITKKIKFHANIDSNLVDRYRKRNQLLLTSTWPASHGRCGLLGLKKKKTDYFKAMENHALFMDVTVNVFSTARGFVHRKVTRADEIVSSLHLQVMNGKLSIEVTTGEYHPDNTARFYRGFYGGFEKFDVEVTVEAMREVAEKIANREGLKGLTLQELIKIVKPARHEIRPWK